MTTAKYERVHGVAREHYNEKRDCSVISLAIAADVSYGKAQAAMRRAGRKPRQGVEIWQILAAAKELGLIAQWIPLGSGTVGKIAQQCIGSNIISSTRHVSACIDGIVHDYVGQRSRKRVDGVISFTTLEVAA